MYLAENTSLTLFDKVTTVCGDSGLADALSAALFMLPQALLDRYGALAMWTGWDGGMIYSPGLKN